jgi:hypothetical protein
MSEKDLIRAVSARFKTLPQRKRIAEIREFASQSAEDAKFIQTYFPDLYQEAFRARTSSASGRSAATRRRKQAATHR